MGDTGSNPPRVRNLQELLRISLAHSDPPSAQEAQSAPNVLDPERAQWLHEAFHSMSVDVAGELLKALKVLESANTGITGDSKSQEEALDCILDYTDNIDFARDFLKLGGLPVILSSLDSPHDKVRLRAADLVAQLTQNHPYCQDEVLKAGGLDILMRMVNDEPIDDVKVKAFYALSCLIRAFDEATDRFTENDGCSVLLRCIQSENRILRTKSLFLLNSICPTSTKIQVNLCKMGIVDQLIANLRMPHEESHEFIASILTSLASQDSCLSDLKKPDLQARLLFEEKMIEIEGREEFQDEYAYYSKLKEMCTEGFDEGDR